MLSNIFSSYLLFPRDSWLERGCGTAWYGKRKEDELWWIILCIKEHAYYTSYLEREKYSSLEGVEYRASWTNYVSSESPYGMAYIYSTFLVWVWTMLTPASMGPLY